MCFRGRKSAVFYFFWKKSKKRQRAPRPPEAITYEKPGHTSSRALGRSPPPPIILARSSSSQRCFWLSLCAEKVGRHINFSLDSVQVVVSS